jgi:hypothetical protein
MRQRTLTALAHDSRVRLLPKLRRTLARCASFRISRRSSVVIVMELQSFLNVARQHNARLFVRNSPGCWIKTVIHFAFVDAHCQSR